MKQLEQELKIQLTEKQYQILCGDDEGAKQINAYFYAPKNNEDTLVRVRQTRGKYILGVKIRKSNFSAVSICDEYEEEISAEQFDVFKQKGIDSALIRRAFGVSLAEPRYFFIGELTTTRVKKNFENFVLELDKNEYLGAVDFELECENNDVGQLDLLKAALRYKFNVACIASEPKSARFFKRWQNVGTSH